MTGTSGYENTGKHYQTVLPRIFCIDRLLAIYDELTIGQPEQLLGQKFSTQKNRHFCKTIKQLSRL